MVSENLNPYQEYNLKQVFNAIYNESDIPFMLNQKWSVYT
jgi:hypothetical protein